MVDKVEKLLRKLVSKQRDRVLEVIDRIIVGDLLGLDVKKLQDVDDKYRVRIGDFRIIFRKVSETQSKIISVDRRSESTYRDV